MPQKIKDIKTSDRQRVISWEAPEEISRKRPKSWYVIMTIAGLILAGIFILIKLYAGAVVMVAIILLLFSQLRAKTQIIRHTLNKDGFSFKDKTYPFEMMKNFWIQEGDYAELHIERTGKLAMPIIVNLHKVDPREVSDFLKTHIPEVAAKNDHLHNKVTNYLRF